MCIGIYGLLSSTLTSWCAMHMLFHVSLKLLVRVQVLVVMETRVGKHALVSYLLL